MRVFLAGVSCVGKSAIGSSLAELLGVEFFDLDDEIEVFFGASIERLQQRFLTMDSYRKEAAKALVNVLERQGSADCVIALPPSGLMGAYWRVIKKSPGTIVALKAKPEKILERITFYDANSKPIARKLTSDAKRHYLRKIKQDISYFTRTYKRAHLQFDISGLNIEQAAYNLKEALKVTSVTLPMQTSNSSSRLRVAE